MAGESDIRLLRCDEEAQRFWLASVVDEFCARSTEKAHSASFTPHTLHARQAAHLRTYAPFARCETEHVSSPEYDVERQERSLRQVEHESAIRPLMR